MLGQGGHAALALMLLLLLLWRQAAPIEVPQDRKSLSNNHICKLKKSMTINLGE